MRHIMRLALLMLTLHRKGQREAPTRTQVDMMIQQSMPQISACYEHLITTRSAGHPPEGDLEVSFEVDPDGKIVEAEVSMVDDPSLEDQSFHACITRAIRGLRLPATRLGGTVRLPFSFMPMPSSN